MTELKTCSRCRSEVELEYFTIDSTGEHNKTCETCLSTSSTSQHTPELNASHAKHTARKVVYNNGGCVQHNGSLSHRLRGLSNIEHTRYAPIKHTIETYRAGRTRSNSDRWVRSALIRSVGNVLLIQPIKKRWVCSKECLQYLGLHIIIQHQHDEIQRALTNHRQALMSIEPDSTTQLDNAVFRYM